MKYRARIMLVMLSLFFCIGTSILGINLINIEIANQEKMLEIYVIGESYIASVISITKYITASNTITDLLI